MKTRAEDYDQLKIALREVREARYCHRWHFRVKELIVEYSLAIAGRWITALTRLVSHRHKHKRIAEGRTEAGPEVVGKSEVKALSISHSAFQVQFIVKQRIS